VEQALEIYGSFAAIGIDNLSSQFAIPLARNRRAKSGYNWLVPFTTLEVFYD
jgi:hypothetical protein